MNSPAEAQAPGDLALQQAAGTLGEVLRARRLRLAAAESCTGGWLAKVLTDIPGSSDWFDGGSVTYSNQAKTAMLGVDPALLARHGAVSEAVVAAMAAGVRRVTDSDAAVAVSGIAGPGGGTAARPVGLVCFGWLLAERSWTTSMRFSGDRESVRRRSVEFALLQLIAALSA